MSDNDISELARLRGSKALDILEEVMEDPIAEDRDRIRAAEAILDRGYGKAAQAIIAVPASRRQAAMLAGMSDEALVAIIEQKQLPRIGPPQTMITIEPTLAPQQRTPSISAALERAARPRSIHGPAAETYEVEIDPLLL